MEELIAEINKAIAAGVMKENPFKDFKVGDMSEANYDQIDLHKNIEMKSFWFPTQANPWSAKVTW